MIRLLRGLLRSSVAVIGVVTFACGVVMWVTGIAQEMPGATALLLVGALVIADTFLPRARFSGYDK